jgi:hypothetical protein
MFDIAHLVSWVPFLSFSIFLSLNASPLHTLVSRHHFQLHPITNPSSFSSSLHRCHQHIVVVPSPTLHRHHLIAAIKVSSSSHQLYFITSPTLRHHRHRHYHNHIVAISVSSSSHHQHIIYIISSLRSTCRRRPHLAIVRTLLA